MINITTDNRSQCCGCNACADACSKNAIIFRTDIEGFWYPEVNMAKCVDCGLCEKVCPIINVEQLKHNDLPTSKCYAAEHKNMEVVFDSTSGGLFSALADLTYRNDGYVGGAIFNEDFSVRHFISNNKEDLPKLRSSKYLQSRLDGFFKDVKSLLLKGEKVLVCGTPCQMAALRAFLRKDYDNLIIADFICRGINSPKVWRKYLDSFEERYGSKVVYCKPKSKEFGWRNLTYKFVLENGKVCYETGEQSNYTKGYLRTGAFCRPSCYDCKFKGYPRISDITLADFWGVEKVDKKMDKNLGTSLVMVNSKKGETFFEEIKKRINYVPVPLDCVEGGNGHLNKSLDPPKVDRKEFFADLDRMTFLQLAEKYIHPSDRTWRKKVKKLLYYGYYFVTTTQLRPCPIYRFFKYNSIKDIIKGDVLITAPYTIIQKSRRGRIEKKGIVRIGYKTFKHSHLETRVLVGPNAVLSFKGKAVIGYGADIEVFKNAKLTIGEGVGMNIGATIVCYDEINIGNYTMLGRHITIRDNNGNHYMNRVGYKNTRPVNIGDKVWLCEQSTIMPGVTVGDGAIVGALSFVVKKVPSHCMVSGHPAEIIDEDILWKY